MQQIEDDLRSVTYEQNRSLALIARVARKPSFACGCLCLSVEDRRRARRVFRIVRQKRRALAEANQKNEG